MPEFLNLETLHIPTHPEAPLLLDGSPLRILSEDLDNNLQDEAISLQISPAIGIATILHNWTPSSLLALLDIESWFSITWNLTLPDSTKLEIGRIRNQITMGKLDKAGLWSVMLTFNISQIEETGVYQGPWIPSIEESMLGDKNIEDPERIETLAREFVKELIEQQRWLTGKGLRHDFFVESLSLGMDPWDDGLAMNPHWLYAALDLTVCSNCESKGQEGKALNRCGRCGTAAYCSSECQQKNWAVHKAVCAMSAEDRGKALSYSQNGGLVNWVGEGEALDAGGEVEDE